MTGSPNPSTNPFSHGYGQAPPQTNVPGHSVGVPGVPTPPPNTAPMANRLGLIAVILAGLALVIGVGLSLFSGIHYGLGLKGGGISLSGGTPTQADIQDALERMPSAYTNGMVLGIVLQIIPTLLGIAAIITGFLSLAKSTLKSRGVLALVIAFSAPILCLIAWAVCLIVIMV